MKQICVIGTGYVGLVTASCFADLGNKVVGLDIDDAKVSILQAGQVPIYEPGLEEVLRRNMAAGRIAFTTSYQEALSAAEFVFLAVGTPSGVDGEADLQYVRMAAESIAQTMGQRLIIINKSTVPVGTGDWVAEIVTRNQPTAIPFSVVSNPEFLREGTALNDFMSPDRVVLGSTDLEAAERVAQLYRPLRATIQLTNLRTAEMIKYASNAFLATRISFINEIASICEKVGADVKEVGIGMGYDKRIGPHYMDAGLGYGGSCFPKDVKALEYMALVHGTHPQLLRAVMDINRDQRRKVIHNLRSLLDGSLTGKTVGLLGLSFKANTDDMREAASVEIARMLAHEGAFVKAYDPAAMENAARVLPEVRLSEDPYDLAEEADALVVITEWNEFKQLDMGRIRRAMRGSVLIDGRNIYDPDVMRKHGFTYRGIGRGY